MLSASNAYFTLAVSVLFLHALFIVWIVLGAFVTRSRPALRWLHVASLVWGILIELLPWPCPLTVLEKWLEAKGMLVYPDIPATILTVAGVVICVLNLAPFGEGFEPVR